MKLAQLLETIQDFDLNDAQRRDLEYKLTDLFAADGVETTGLEVTHVQDEGDCFKVFFVYEKNKKDIKTSMYFNARFTQSGVENFTEKKFK